MEKQLPGVHFVFNIILLGPATLEQHGKQPYHLILIVSCSLGQTL